MNMQQCIYSSPVDREFELSGGCGLLRASLSKSLHGHMLSLLLGKHLGVKLLDHPHYVLRYHFITFCPLFLATILWDRYRIAFSDWKAPSSEQLIWNWGRNFQGFLTCILLTYEYIRTFLWKQMLQSKSSHHKLAQHSTQFHRRDWYMFMLVSRDTYVPSAEGLL